MALDPARYEELAPAPRAVFDRLDERRTRPRFMVRDGDDWRSVTWGAYATAIRRTTCWLADGGFAPGDRAAIFAGNRVEWMVASHAIQSAGGVLVPIYPASTPSQAAYVAQHSDARVLFLDGAELLGRVVDAWTSYASVRSFVLLGDDLDVAAVLAARKAKGVAVPSFGEVQDRLVSWRDVQARGAARDAEKPGGFQEMLDAVRLEQPGLMLYTSGTTGNPKGVPLTHLNVGANGRDWMRTFGPMLDEDLVDVHWLPMSHIFGLGQAAIGDLLGYTTYLDGPATVLATLPQVRPHVFMSVPAYWEKLAGQVAAEQAREKRRAKLAQLTGGRLRFCLSGGAGLKREVKELFYECGLVIFEGYGLTECSPTLTLNRPGDFRFDSVGKAIPSVRLKLAEDGEILAKGPSVFAGYHKDPEATREVFSEDGWFKTGDVGRFTDDGFLQIIDRKKEILVTAGGKNVPPANIEMRFADDPLFSHVVVYGDGQKFLVAGVWLDPEVLDAELARAGGTGERAARVDALVQARVDAVNADLAKFEQVKKFRVMDVPLTVAGGLLTSTLKVRRKKVWEAFQREYDALYQDTRQA
jgi:long-chain acyl-CoA synthetase